MAIKMSPAEISTFKANLEQMLPYHHQELLNTLAQGLYNSSNYTYERVKGLSGSIAINKIQMYSRHNVIDECKRLCEHLRLSKIYQYEISLEEIDEIECSLFPKRRELINKLKEQAQIECGLNEELLRVAPEPVHVNTADFPEIARHLIITNAADPAFEHAHQEPLSVTIYGLAAAHVVDYLHSIYPQLEINVVILNPEITAIMMCLDAEMGKRLAHPHVHLTIGNDDTEIAAHRVLILPEMNLDPLSNTRLKQRLWHQLDKHYDQLVNYKSSRNFQGLLARYTYGYCKVAEQLKSDTFNPTSEVALVFPGPSLSDCFERLCILRQQGVRIIACDAALPFLEAQSFAPDIVVASNRSIYHLAGPHSEVMPPLCLLKAELYQRSALIVSSRTHLRIPSLFSGPIYLAYTPDLHRRGITKQEGALTELDITNSNSSLMVDLAIRQQAQRIYLIGFDAICRPEQYYVGIDSKVETTLYGYNMLAQMDIVPCNDGKTRRAPHCFNLYRLHLEEVIAKQKYIDFVNCSPYGIVVKGSSRDYYTIRSGSYYIEN